VKALGVFVSLPVKITGSNNNDGIYNLVGNVINGDPVWTFTVFGTLTAEAAGASVTIEVA
jgi:hypothetical protein